MRLIFQVIGIGERVNCMYALGIVLLRKKIV